MRSVVLICISLRLVVLSTFSCIYWTFVCLLWKNVSCNLLPFLNQTGVFLLLFCFYFCYRVVWVLYVLWILTSYQIYDFQVFFPIQSVAFHFNNYLHFAKDFWLDIVPLIHFCFCCFCCQIQKIIIKTKVKELTAYILL